MPLKYPGTDYYHALPAVKKTWAWVTTCDTEENVIKNPTEAVPLFDGMYGDMHVTYSLEHMNTLRVEFQVHNHPTYYFSEEEYGAPCFVHMKVEARVRGRHGNKWHVISSPNQHDVDRAPVPVEGCKHGMGPRADVCFEGQEGIYRPEFLADVCFEGQEGIDCPWFQDPEPEMVEYDPIYVSFKATVWVYRRGDITGRIEIPLDINACKKEACNGKERDNKEFDALWLYRHSDILKNTSSMVQ
jgi:hypothetical protein